MPFYIAADKYAVYAMGARDIPLTATVATSISTVITPRIAELHLAGNKIELRKLWHQAEVRAAFIIMPIFAACMAASQALFTLLYTDQYVAGVWLFRTYLLLLPLQALLQRPVLAACGRTGFIFGSAVFRACAGVVGVILLANWIGFYGPPFAVVATAYVCVLGMAWRIKRELELKWREIFPFARLLPIGFTACAAGSVAFLAVQFLQNKFLACLVAGCVTLAIYIPLLFILRLVDDKDRELIRHNWNRVRRLFSKKSEV
jgi:O-antigen/teichoic acid export membrane protein